MQQGRIDLALCDDDRDFLCALASQVREIMREQCLSCELFSYESAEALLDDIHKGRSFSILLLDVMMEGLDGMSLTRTLRAEARQMPVIFISSNRETALYGYELDALRFLAKPVERERLREALLSAWKALQTRVIAMQAADGLRRVDIGGIGYAEMMRRGVSLHMTDRTVIPTHVKISEMETMLPGMDFFRCHQGYIVNLGEISTIQRTTVVLKSGECVPVSRYKLSALRDRFMAYLND